MFKRLSFYYNADTVGSDSSQNKEHTGNSTNEAPNAAKNASEELKTMTQKELQEMLAKEKRQGKNSVLNALGIKTVEEGKSVLGAAQAAANANKSAEQLAADALNAANKAKADVEDELAVARRTIFVMKAGFAPEYVEDVVAIASRKATDSKDFDAIVEEMKQTHKFYLIAEAKTNEGTGAAAAGYRKNGASNEEESIGARLAKKNAEKNKSASEYNFFK